MQKLSKAELRTQFRLKRKAISNKFEKDAAVFENLISLPEFINADTVLCYASLDEEIDTYNLISYALKNGKTVALPVCTDKNGNMSFYAIESTDDVVNGSFNIKEPDVRKCKEILDYTGCVVIVPALCFDKAGYRIGYGGGYYDKFSEKHSLISIGLCYNSFVVEKLPVESYDKCVNYIVTETAIINCNNGGKNG